MTSWLYTFEKQFVVSPKGEGHSSFSLYVSTFVIENVKGLTTVIGELSAAVAVSGLAWSVC